MNAPDRAVTSGLIGQSVRRREDALLGFGGIIAAGTAVGPGFGCPGFGCL